MHGTKLLIPIALLAACGGGSLPQPPHSAPPAEAFIEVPYPPPAALSELVPQPPERKDVVFQDGGWTWRGNYFVWQRGGWVAPRPGMKLCPWTFRYLADGRALFTENRWVDEKGELTRPPAILVPAVTPTNEVTAEFQTGR